MIEPRVSPARRSPPELMQERDEARSDHRRRPSATARESARTTARHERNIGTRRLVHFLAPGRGARLPAFPHADRGPVRCASPSGGGTRGCGLGARAAGTWQSQPCQGPVHGEARSRSRRRAARRVYAGERTVHRVELHGEAVALDLIDESSWLAVRMQQHETRGSIESPAYSPAVDIGWRIATHRIPPGQSTRPSLLTAPVRSSTSWSDMNATARSATVLGSGSATVSVTTAGTACSSWVPASDARVGDESSATTWWPRSVSVRANAALATPDVEGQLTRGRQDLEEPREVVVPEEVVVPLVCEPTPPSSLACVSHAARIVGRSASVTAGASSNGTARASTPWSSSSAVSRPTARLSRSRARRGHPPPRR